MDIQQLIEQIKTSFFSQLQSVKSEEDLEKIRIHFLGRKGEIAELMTTFKTLKEDERRKFGPIIQELRSSLEKTLIEKSSSVKALADKTPDKEFFDVTTSLYSELKGTKHIFSEVEVKRLYGHVRMIKQILL